MPPPADHARQMIRPRRRLAGVPAVLLMMAVLLPLPVVTAVDARHAAGRARMVITFRPGVDGRVADRLAARSGHVVERIDQLGVRVVELPAAAAERARVAWLAEPAVRGVERDERMTATWTPNDPLTDAQWEQRRIHLPRAWNVSRGAASTMIAVIDTGVQVKHRDLAGHTVAGWDFVNRDAHPSDDNGHGTAVAGVAAATAGNGIGIAGACSRCTILPVKVLDANGYGWWTVAAKGILYATDHGADVINMSFTGPSGGSTLGQAIAYARAHDVVVVAAAGNQGSTAPGYPAAYPGVIGVAASTSADARYSWSNYSRAWVDVAAPGCTTTTYRGGGYGGFCGTSAATPMVAGVAGLVDARRPNRSGAWIESVLKGSTYQTIGSFTRYGRLDARAAMHQAARASQPSVQELLPAEPYFEPLRKLSLAAGTHTGYRFDTAGDIIAQRTISLDGPVSPSTIAQGTVPWQPATWFHVASGRLSGYWIAESSRVSIQPQPTPTPTPTASPTPTPAPSG
jgi:subtilisin family serine protease